MMEIGIRSVGFDAKDHLVKFAEERVKKLERFYENIQKVEVFLRLKSDAVTNKEAGIRIHVPGTELYASKSSETFEEAVDVVFDALRKQLIKYKDKQ